MPVFGVLSISTVGLLSLPSVIPVHPLSWDVYMRSGVGIGDEVSCFSTF